MGNRLFEEYDLEVNDMDIPELWIENFKKEHGVYPGDLVEIDCACGHKFLGHIDSFPVCGLCQSEAIAQVKKDLGRM